MTSTRILLCSALGLVSSAFVGARFYDFGTWFAAMMLIALADAICDAIRARIKEQANGR